MRLLLAVGVSFWLSAAPPALAEQTFPYKAYVIADEVYVRSGPGQSYYPTDKLKLGQPVEVYRHDPGGWYAIKPPADSFTWVSGRFLKPGSDNLAVVDDDRIAARVGSRFSDIRDVIQVRLQKGEVVEILDSKQADDGTGPTTWYKIAPPSGEFRWVFGKYVDPNYPADGLRKSHGPEQRPLDAGTARPIESGATPVAANPVPPAAAMPAAWSPTTQTPPTTRTPVNTAVALRAEPAAQPAASGALSTEQHQAALEAMDLELSTMVTEEPTVWTFQELRPRAESLLAAAETAVERGRARVMVDKLTRFEDIKQRYDAIHAPQTQYEQTHRSMAALAERERQANAPAPGEDRFDGVGQLTRVVSPKLGAPRFALIDSGGGVLCYVTPAPGVPLQHYVGHRIGINGTRGYMPEQQAQHIMAQHVSALESRVR